MPNNTEENFVVYLEMNRLRLFSGDTWLFHHKLVKLTDSVRVTALPNTDRSIYL